MLLKKKNPPVSTIDRGMRERFTTVSASRSSAATAPAREEEEAVALALAPAERAGSEVLEQIEAKPWLLQCCDDLE